MARARPARRRPLPLRLLLEPGRGVHGVQRHPPRRGPGRALPPRAHPRRGRRAAVRPRQPHPSRRLDRVRASGRGRERGRQRARSSWPSCTAGRRPATSASTRLARRLARFLLAQQRADGSILQYWRPATRRSVPDVFGKFSTGEAFYALALMHAGLPRRRAGSGPRTCVADYLATRRDEAEGHSVRQPDHWAAYGLAELAPAGLTEVEAEYARWLAGYFGFLVRLESQHVGRRPQPVLGIRRRPRDGRRGDDGALAARGRGPPARRPPRRPRRARAPALPGILVERQVARRRARIPGRAAPGSPTATRRWTTSSTPSPRSSAPARPCR